jgi:threonine aldolase
MIDLRTDTVTRPTPEMRSAMAAADVGDDVFGEDPTVRRLEERIAGMLGMEAALFVPSGTMGNQLGVRVHCQPGDEFLCEAGCHIYNSEQGAYAQFFSIAPHPIPAPQCHLNVALLQDNVRADDVHAARSRLVCLENTHNRGGGCVLDYGEVERMGRWAQERGIARHLDGARLFNAVVASGIAADKWAQHFDTVSVCFSKGLGAPIGSALCGHRDLIAVARRVRKPLGGGWRQAGIIAAGALYALDHHIDRLAEDHANARLIADALRDSGRVQLVPPNVDTNIVLFRFDPKLGTSGEFCQRMEKRGVMLSTFGPAVRVVTHMNVTAQDCRQAAAELVKAVHP